MAISSPHKGAKEFCIHVAHTLVGGEGVLFRPKNNGLKGSYTWRFSRQFYKQVTVTSLGDFGFHSGLTVSLHLSHFVFI